jgi:hypothetical protein
MVFIIACDETPPVEPEPDPVMGCKVEGEITVNYSSGKGFIGILQNEVFQYYFSSYKVIDGKEYGLLISLFPENPADTIGVFPIVPQDNSPDSGNYAYAAFVIHNQKPGEIQFWAESGRLDISFVSLGKKNNKIVGTFSFTALDKATKQKSISVTDGWVNLVKEL